MLTGVIVGIALSLVWLVYVATSPGMPSLGREPGTQVFRDVAENPNDERFPGIAVVRLDGGLFFATADALEERVRGLVLDGDEPVRAVVLDLEGVDFVDSQGAAKLVEILEFLESSEVELRLARLKPSVASILEKDRVLDLLGPDHLHGNIHRAVEAQLAADRADGSRAPDLPTAAEDPRADNRFWPGERRPSRRVTLVRPSLSSAAPRERASS